MNRVCIFAHWDKDNIIDDYVIYYLRALQKICSTIIFVSDCNLPHNELEKIKEIVYHSIAQRHGEYDFGSYKRGFLYAKEQNLKYEELIFANDSCYGPFYPLKSIFEKMNKKKCDFWGLTQNRYGLQKEKSQKLNVAPHIQSYFLVFKKNVFSTNIFEKFIYSISKEDKKENIIEKYEIGLSNLLYSNNFKGAVYINKYYFEHNCLATKWNKLIYKDKFPFLKTTIIKNGFYFTGEVKNWEKYLKNTKYPIDLIKKHSLRVLDLYENKYAKLNLYRKIRFHILSHFPPEIRLLVIYCEKYSFLILNTLFFNKLKKF